LGEVALRFLQGALESSKGSNQAATRIIAGKVTSPAFNQTRVFVDEDRGSFAQNYRFSQGIRDYGFTLDVEQATFEQLPWLLQTAVKGSVVPSTVGSTGKRVIFTPSTTGVSGDDLQSATFEFGDDTQSFSVTYAEANSFTLGFETLAVGNSIPVKFSGQYMAKSLGSNTKTAGLTYPTLETIEGMLGTFYLGDTATAYPSLAQVTGSLRSFTLNWDNKLARKVFVGDGKNFSAIGRGKREVTFTAVFEGNSAGVTRFVEWDTAAQKRMRLIFTGTTIAASTPATARELIIDGNVLFTSFDPVGTVDTNTIFTMSGSYMYESTASGGLGAEIRLTVTNDVPTYT
jgi:hypothetical protein